MASVLRKANIQGDVWPGLRKRFQSFIFFRIQKPDEFRSRLQTFIPQITTAEGACNMKGIIAEEKVLARKKNQPAKLQPLPGVNSSSRRSTDGHSQNLRQTEQVAFIHKAAAGL
ncbi:Dyp-type peroxidase [Penicillium fimorum]|uniref:Dyp-type peroxidase n=1 Tax=Penicillium fimorum TaxID=1882269 RepID=A0A9X0C104_9EURO|nr:Dyp-type peroxidase [Penicillium fimorum]